ncbi:Peptidase family M23 [Frankineae bacterium MT45]|nr:Peptidase family M23 [Frankineae bacterium MT45]
MTLAVLLSLFLAVPAGAAGSAGGGGGMSVTAYRLPVALPTAVLRPFAAPLSRYGAGHRGVDLAADQGGAVIAPAAGEVVFAGAVAGRGIVVLSHPDGVRTEYEPVTPKVRVGESVAVGQLIAVLHGRHPGCPAIGCLHWGARRGDVYFDPLLLLHPLGLVRLLPGR